MIRFWVAAVGAWLAAGVASTEPLVKRDVVYYDVTGATAQEIRAEMGRLGPIDQITGKRFDATTRWHVKWTYRYRNVGQDCAVARVAVTVDVTITMPRLKSDAPASAELRRMFDEFAKKLMIHEEGHADNGIEAGKNIETAILAMKEQQTCDAMGRAANELAQSLIKEANKKDIEYDARTAHGRLQGARLP